MELFSDIFVSFLFSDIYVCNLEKRLGAVRDQEYVVLDGRTNITKRKERMAVSVEIQIQFACLFVKNSQIHSSN